MGKTESYRVRVTFNLENQWDKKIYEALLEGAPRRGWAVLIKKTLLEHLEQCKRETYSEPLPIPEDAVSKLEQF